MSKAALQTAIKALIDAVEAAGYTDPEAGQTDFANRLGAAIYDNTLLDQHGWVPLDTIDITSATEYYELTSLMDSTKYDTYALVVDQFRPTISVQELGFQLSPDNGSTWRSDANYYNTLHYWGSASHATANYYNTPVGKATHTVYNVTSSYHCTGIFHLFGAHNASLNTEYQWWGNWSAVTAVRYGGHIEGHYLGNIEAHNAIRLMASSLGTHTAGHTMALLKGTFYGLRRAA